MEKFKISKSIASNIGLRKYVTLILIALALQSCSKADNLDPVIYNGRVLVYDGPEIGEYDEINTSYLKPFADVQVFIWSCRPWAGWTGGGCNPKGRIKEMDVTDSEGKFSISFMAHNDLSYTAEIDYRRDYLEKGETYDDDMYNEIILVPRSLIK